MLSQGFALDRQCSREKVLPGVREHRALQGSQPARSLISRFPCHRCASPATEGTGDLLPRTARGRHADALVRFRHGRTRRWADRAVRVAPGVAPGDQQCLQMPTRSAAQARIAGGPWRAQRRGACAAVSEMGNRERRGCGPVVRRDGVAVAADEAAGALRPGGPQAPGLRVAGQHTTVGLSCAGWTARLQGSPWRTPHVAASWRWIRAHLARASPRSCTLAPLAVLGLGLALGTPAFATMTVQDAGSYLTRTASTGYGTTKGTPTVGPYVHLAPAVGMSDVVPSFQDRQSGQTTAGVSSVDWDGSIEVVAAVGDAEGGAQSLFIEIRGSARVHAHRDPAYDVYSAGGYLNARGKIRFTMSQPACYHATGDVTSFNDRGHSESSVKLPEGLPRSSVGDLGDLTYYPGPFDLQGDLLPGTYEVVAQVKENHTLGGQDADDDLRGQSNVYLRLYVTEDCSKIDGIEN